MTGIGVRVAQEMRKRNKYERTTTGSQNASFPLFFLFSSLCLAHARARAHGRGLNMFSPHRTFSLAEAEQLLRVADVTGRNTLRFSEFYAVFACLTLLESKFGLLQETYLTSKQVKAALAEAGLAPTERQLKEMFRLTTTRSSGGKAGAGAGGSASQQGVGGVDGGGGGGVGEDGARIELVDLFSIYINSPRSESDLFFRSWFQAGRGLKKHVHISPFHDFVAGTFAGVALTLVGHPFDTIKVRVQTQARARSAVEVFRSTITRESPLALFKGKDPRGRRKQWRAGSVPGRAVPWRTKPDARGPVWMHAYVCVRARVRASYLRVSQRECGRRSSEERKGI